MTDTTESTTDEANSTGDEQTVMLPESMVAYLYRGAVVGLAGLALVATIQFYLSASRAISIWIASDYEPFFQSAFNLAVILACGLGLSLLVSRLRGDESVI